MSQLWPCTKHEDEPASIARESIPEHLNSYPSHISPALRALDNLRFEEIPTKLVQRKKAGDAFLEKSEVSSLVEWKLKHGTYRPKLATLVASNSDEAIRSTTTSAFATYSADNDAYIESIKTLSQLKGIGPATASLLLSCYDPAKVPFLSDQLFRYALWKRAKGQGWDRKIKYSVAEYVEMFSAVQGLRERLEKESGSSVSAMDLEKAAYVLAKEAEPGSKRYDVDEEGGKKEEVVEPQKPSKKRKSAANEDGNKKEEAGARSKAKRRR